MAVAKGKVPVLILVVLIVFSLLLAAGLYVFLQKERRVNADLTQQLQGIQEKQRITEAKLEESKKMISAFEAKLKDTQIQIEALNSELEAEKSAKQESLNQVEQLKADLEQNKLLKSDVEQKLDDAQSQIRKSQDRLSQLEKEKADLEGKIKALEVKSKDLETKVQGIELGTIVVSPENKEAAVQPAAKEPEKPAKKGKKPAAKKEIKNTQAGVNTTAEGNVLVVNKDYNFAVINLGNKEGVKVGSVFAVYHNDKHIGDIKVEKVHESMSAAGFVSGNLKDTISEGDKVVSKL